MYQLVVFDMDGTLTDTSPGIINSHRYAHSVMGRPVPSLEVLTGVIGGPLLQTYIDKFHFSEQDARKAVAAYRDYYSKHGIYEAHLYPGMEDALKRIHQNGSYIALATLKAERFAKEMLSNLGVFEYFSVVYGMDDGDTRTKPQLIEMCMNTIGVSRKNTLMVGDSIHDLNGASSCGVDFLGVSYGFGFSPGESMENPIANSTEEIVTFTSQTDG